MTIPTHRFAHAGSDGVFGEDDRSASRWPVGSRSARSSPGGTSCRSLRAPPPAQHRPCRSRGPERPGRSRSVCCPAARRSRTGARSPSGAGADRSPRTVGRHSHSQGASLHEWTTQPEHRSGPRGAGGPLLHTSRPCWQWTVIRRQEPPPRPEIVHVPAPAARAPPGALRAGAGATLARHLGRGLGRRGVQHYDDGDPRPGAPWTR